MSIGFTDEQVRDNLKNVYDPEIGVNIVDLGLIYDVDVEETGDVLVTMTLTSIGCPLGPVILQEVNGALRDLPGIGEIDVKLVWSPPWSPDLMSEDDVDNPELDRDKDDQGRPEHDRVQPLDVIGLRRLRGNGRERLLLPTTSQHQRHHQGKRGKPTPPRERGPALRCLVLRLSAGG